MPTATLDVAKTPKVDQQEVKKTMVTPSTANSKQKPWSGYLTQHKVQLNNFMRKTRPSVETINNRTMTATKERENESALDVNNKDN